MIQDLEYMKKINITYHSINIECRKDDDDKWLHQEDNEDRLKKFPKNMPSYANKKLDTYFNENYNGTMISMGECYNLIGIDIDKLILLDKLY
jgi:hypothetical protein